MKTKFLPIALDNLLVCAIICSAQSPDPLSIRYANRFSERNTGWTYTSGVVMTALEQLYLVTGDSDYYNLIITNMNEVSSEYGDFIFPYLYEGWSYDNVRPACQLVTSYWLTGDERYSLGSDTFFNSIQHAPRNSYDEIWHKDYYVHQTWLDGIYMGGPFYAAYNRAFSKPELQEDVVHQITEMYAHAWDPDKKLLYHGWYDVEADTMAEHPYWDLDGTGISTVFWGRSIGWYAMALVDVLDILPATHPGRDSLISLFSNLAEGIATYQDPDSLVWWQVVDQAKRDSNWIESSASCMYVYALLKGVRMAYLDSVYLETATTGYQGILDKFLVEDDDELALRNVCEGTGVGPDYAFYVDRRKHTGGSHAHGAFILASIEMEMMDSVYPPGLLRIDSVVHGAINISWNKTQHNVLGYVLERKTNGSFTGMAELGADTTCYTDSIIEPNTDYVYRVCACTQEDTSRWSNCLKVTSANVDGLPSPAFLPFPANHATNIRAGQVLKWRKGLLADYHKLYFGTTDPPPFAADLNNSSFNPENLQVDSVYYWRIDEVNEKGITAGDTWRFDMETSVSTESLHNTGALNLYPNPASEVFYLEGVESGSTVSVYDLSGKLFYSDVVTKEKLEIDSEDWQKGVFIIQIKGAERISYVKLIKE